MRPVHRKPGVFRCDLFGVPSRHWSILLLPTRFICKPVEQELTISNKSLFVCKKSECTLVY